MGWDSIRAPTWGVSRSDVSAGLRYRCSPILHLSMLLVTEKLRAWQLISQALVSQSAKLGDYRLTDVRGRDGAERSRSCCSDGKLGSPLQLLSISLTPGCLDERG